MTINRARQEKEKGQSSTSFVVILINIHNSQIIIICIILVMSTFIAISKTSWWNECRNFKAHEVSKERTLHLGKKKQKTWYWEWISESNIYQFLWRATWINYTYIFQRKKKKSTSSTSRGINIVSIFAYASETVEVSVLFTFWFEPVEPSSHAVGFLDAFVLARSSFANSRACKVWHT